jgi:hypothetical protein
MHLFTLVVHLLVTVNQRNHCYTNKMYGGAGGGSGGGDGMGGSGGGRRWLWWSVVFCEASQINFVLVLFLSFLSSSKKKSTR